MVCRLEERSSFPSKQLCLGQFAFIRILRLTVEGKIGGDRSLLSGPWSSFKLGQGWTRPHSPALTVPEPELSIPGEDNSSPEEVEARGVIKT